MSHYVTRRFRGVILVGCGLLLGGLPLSATIGQVPEEAAQEKPQQQTLIEISKETTYLTEPLDDKGFVMMSLAVDRLLASRTTPEDNGAIDYLKAIGGQAEGRTLEFACRELGIEIAPQDERFIKNPRAYGTLKQWPQGRWLELSELSSELTNVPWKTEDYPDLAAWLDHCEPGFKQLESAVAKPGWYIPRTAEGGGMVAILIGEVQEARTVARALGCRAMRHLANQRYEEAWQDIMLTRKLGRKIAQGPTIIEGLVGYAIDGIACQASVRWLRNVPRMYDSYEDKIESLRKLPRMPSLANSMLFERVMYIDSVVSIARRGTGEEDLVQGLGVGGNQFDSIGALLKAMETTTPDWNIILRDANKFHDRIEDALRTDEATLRREKMAAIEADIQERAKKTQQLSNLPVMLAKWLLFPKQGRREISEMLSNAFIAMMLPSLTMLDNSASRTENSADVVLLAMKIAGHRAETGKFPESLESLQLPDDEWNITDRFTQKPFAYERKGGGFVLYHFGRDGKDDGGPNEDGSQNPKDFGVYLTK